MAVTKEQELKIIDLYTNGTSVIQISKDFNLGKDSVYNILKNNNCELNHKKRSTFSEKDFAEMAKLYNEGCKTREISRKFNINSATLYYHLKNNCKGVVLKNKKGGNDSMKKKYNKKKGGFVNNKNKKDHVISKKDMEEMIYCYDKLGFSGEDIGKLYNRHYVTVYNIIKNFGKDIKKHNLRTEEEIQAQENNRSEIADLYSHNDIPINRQINQEMYNCNANTVLSCAAEFGVLRESDRFPDTVIIIRSEKKIRIKRNKDTEENKDSKDLSMSNELNKDLLLTNTIENTESVVEDSEIYNQLFLSNKDFSKVNIEKHIYCSMFTDRHAIPAFVNKSIFETDGLAPAQIFDFEFINRSVADFIIHNINFDSNGLPDADIVCYVSGLQSVFGALCSVCARLHINLKIYHYNKGTGLFSCQTIFDQFPNANSNALSLGNLNTEFDEYYFYKIDNNNLTDLDNLCVIKRLVFNDDQQIIKKIGIITKDENCWELFGIVAQNQLDLKSNAKMFCSLYKTYNKGSEIVFSATCATSSNFKYQK